MLLCKRICLSKAKWLSLRKMGVLSVTLDCQFLLNLTTSKKNLPASIKDRSQCYAPLHCGEYGHLNPNPKINGDLSSTLPL